MNFNDIATVPGYWENKGIGRYQTVTYRRVRTTAIDPSGKERTVLFQADSRGQEKATWGPKTVKQLQSEYSAEWVTIPAKIANTVRTEWPNLNDLQQLTIAKMMTGTDRSNTGTIRAVIGGAARYRFQEMFPGVDSVDGARATLKDYGSRIMVQP
jgi:hypothetical protein